MEERKTTQMKTPSNAQSIKTTKILALGTLTAPLTTDQQREFMPQEVPGTLRLYLNGVIDQWFARKDGTGVAFLLNVTSVEEANALLEVLPLGKANLMKFELIPLGPLFPLRMLLGN